MSVIETVEKRLSAFSEEELAQKRKKLEDRLFDFADHGLLLLHVKMIYSGLFVLRAHGMRAFMAYKHRITTRAYL